MQNRTCLFDNPNRKSIRVNPVTEINFLLTTNRLLTTVRAFSKCHPKKINNLQTRVRMRQMNRPRISRENSMISSKESRKVFRWCQTCWLKSCSRCSNRSWRTYGPIRTLILKVEGNGCSRDFTRAWGGKTDLSDTQWNPEPKASLYHLLMSQLQFKLGDQRRKPKVIRVT